MITKRKDEEEDDNHDDISEVNKDEDTPSKAQKIRTPKLQKRYRLSIKKLGLSRAPVPHL